MKRTTTPTTVAEVMRTCASCGARAPGDRVRITVDRLRGDGREHLWNLCDACHDAEAVDALDGAVLRDLLGIEPGDPVLAAIRVPRFCDRAAHHPDHPNATPWAHVNRSELADTVEQWRNERAALAGGPCSFCGMGWTPAGTTWRTWSSNAVPFTQCGRCAYQFGRYHVGSEALRDAAAVVLGGLTRGSSATFWPGIGRQLGVVFWHESKRSTANGKPFEHLDVAGVRQQLAAIFDTGGRSRPSWWRQDRVVTW